MLPRTNRNWNRRACLARRGFGLVVPKLTPGCLGGNGGMVPYSNPSIVSNKKLYSPFPHSLLSTRELKPHSLGFLGASCHP